MEDPVEKTSQIGPRRSVSPTEAPTGGLASAPIEVSDLPGALATPSGEPSPLGGTEPGTGELEQVGSSFEDVGGERGATTSDGDRETETVDKEWEEASSDTGSDSPQRKATNRWRSLQNHMRSDTFLRYDIRMYKSLFGIMGPGVRDSDGDTLSLKEFTRDLRWRQYIILPDNKIRVWWDLAQCVILPYLAFATPVMVSFERNSMGILFVLEFIIDVYFLIDMVVMCLSAYVDEHHLLQTKPLLCARHYLRTWFIVDALSLMPIDYVVRGVDGVFVCSFEVPSSEECSGRQRSSGDMYKMLKLLRLLKLVKLLRLVKFNILYEKYQDYLLEVAQLLTVARIVFLLVFLAHLFGCLFFFFSDTEWLTADEQAMSLRTWIYTEFGDQPEKVPLNIVYTCSLYWAVTTMTTVGYGDIAATSMAERVWACCAMILGTVFFSYMIAYIVKEVETAQMERNAFNQKMMSVRSFILDTKLNTDIRSKVMAHFRTQTIKAYDEKALLAELPFELRTEMLQSLYRGLIQSVPLFKSGDQVLITELCTHVSPVSFTKGTVVYKQGEMAREMYIVSTGQVLVTNHKGSASKAVLGKGAYFGESCCFGHARRTETIRALTSCTLLAIHHADMREVLELFPGVLEEMASVHRRRLKEFALAEDSVALNHAASERKSLLFPTESHSDHTHAEYQRSLTEKPASTARLRSTWGPSYSADERTEPAGWRARTHDPSSCTDFSLAQGPMGERVEQPQDTRVDARTERLESKVDELSAKMSSLEGKMDKLLDLMARGSFRKNS